ncbi:MAG TPA: 6,7-dimethyl-8-ribityllumazine synthase [Solirubrobacterales bacterium]|nr:6,7-dimethyl-8-ribityllumazine synthase [Solirubrobacterales bacterium]
MAEAGAFLEEFKDEEKAKLAELQFAVVVGRFYEDLALRLLDGADAGFKLAGVPMGNVAHHSVPGAYELPFAANAVIDGVRRHNAKQGGGPEIGGVACLGVVIRGETDHYDFVCAEAARGIQDVQLATGVPCAFGVITCDTMDQALARAGGDKRDQGRNAALTVARMALLKRQVG